MTTKLLQIMGFEGIPDIRMIIFFTAIREHCRWRFANEIK